MKKISVLTGILLILLFVSLAHHSWGQEKAQPQTGVSVVIGKFYSDEIAGKRLENDVPFLINRSLLSYKGLIMVEDNRFGTITVATKDYTQKSFVDEYEGLDYILYGDVASLKDGYAINAFLFDTKNNLIYDLKPVKGDNTTLFDMCTEIGKAVSGKIYELNTTISDQGITFALVSDAEMTMNKKGSETDYLTDLLIRKAIKNLEYYENFKVLPYDECVKFYGMREDEIAEYIKANGIIHLKMVEREDFVQLLIPTFYHKSKKDGQAFDMKIIMPTIPSDYYQHIEFIDFVLSELLSFVNAIVTEDGNLKLDELVFTSDSPGEYIRQGEKYQDQAQLFLSNYYYYKALELTKEPPLRNEIYYQLGDNKVGQNRLAEAEEEFQKILANDPENLLGTKGLGIISMHREDYNDAYKKFSYVAKENPKDENIYLLLGVTQFELGYYKPALETLKKDRMMNPGNPVSSRYIGLSYIQLKQYDASIQEFQKLYDQDPKNGDNYYYLSYSLAEKGISEYNNGNYPVAVEYINKSNKIQPLNYTSNYLRLSYIRLGKYAAASELIEEEILRKNYDRTDIYYKHALDVREFFLKNYDSLAGTEVIRNLMESLKYDDNPLAYYYLGNTYIYLGQIDTGLDYLKQAREKDPNNTSIHLDLMEAMLMNNRFDDCIAFYEARLDEVRTYVMTEKYLALMDYLMISAMRLTGKDYHKYEKELDNILEFGTNIDNWSYVPYRQWLEAGNFKPEDKSFLLDLTKQMEKAGK